MPKHRSKSQIERDRRRIADLYLQGWLQADIADEIGIDQSMISRDLKVLQGEWHESTLIDFNEARANELAKVDRLEREYWGAWNRSCLDAETTKQKGTPTGDKINTVSIEKTAKGQAGDPRFLTGVQWCINKRCEILGLDSPEIHELTGKDGTPLFDMNAWNSTRKLRKAVFDQVEAEAKAKRATNG